jgi:hypothetical protein
LQHASQNYKHPLSYQLTRLLQTTPVKFWTNESNFMQMLTKFSFILDNSILICK